MGVGPVTAAADLALALPSPAASPPTGSSRACGRGRRGGGGCRWRCVLAATPRRRPSSPCSPTASTRPRPPPACRCGSSRCSATATTRCTGGSPRGCAPRSSSRCPASRTSSPRSPAAGSSWRCATTARWPPCSPVDQPCSSATPRRSTRSRLTSATADGCSAGARSAVSSSPPPSRRSTAARPRSRGGGNAARPRGGQRRGTRPAVRRRAWRPRNGPSARGGSARGRPASSSATGA